MNNEYECQRLRAEVSELRYARDEAVDRASAAMRAAEAAHHEAGREMDRVMDGEAELRAEIERERDEALAKLDEVEAQAASMREVLAEYVDNPAAEDTARTIEAGKAALSGDAGRALLARVAKKDAALRECETMLEVGTEETSACIWCGATHEVPMARHHELGCLGRRLLAAVKEALR